MQSFTISPLADPAGCYAAWPSPARRVTRNRHGTFYVVEIPPVNVPNGYPNTFAILRDDGSGTLVPLWTGANLPTNMVALDSFLSGELYAAWSDWINGVSYVACWADPSACAAPVVTTLPGTSVPVAPGVSWGITKAALIADEGRRALYYAGDNGLVIRLGEAGTELGRQTVFKSAGDAINYVDLELDENGQLFLFMCGAISAANGNPDYDYAGAVMTPDPSDIGGSGPIWLAGPWTANNTPLALPITANINGPAAWLTLGEQTRNSNNLFMGAAVHQGLVHALIAEYGGNGGRGLDTDDLRHLSVEALALPWATQPMVPAGISHRPLRHGAVFPRCASGRPVVRECGVIHILADRASLIAMRSSDGGRTFQVHAQTPVPDLGTDTIHHLSVMPGDFGDPDVIGMFAVLHCRPPEWAGSTCPVPPAYAPNNPGAKALRFSLPA